VPSSNPQSGKQVEVAKAAAVMVNLETGDHKLVDLVEDSGEGLDPQMRCKQLWESVKDDWPGYQVTYVLNDSARELMSHRRMWGWGFTDDNPMTARIESYNAEVEGRRVSA
jgi:hypothetical protein